MTEKPDKPDADDEKAAASTKAAQEPEQPAPVVYGHPGTVLPSPADPTA